MTAIKKLIYLDYAATTPVRPEVVRVMQPFWTKDFGNPSALYKQGLKAKAALEAARQSVADTLSARPGEIVFTAGGSESINLAIGGAAKAYREKHKTGGHIITSQVEHHAVLKTVAALAADSFRVTYLRVDANGFVDPAEVKKAIRNDTFLVSVMYANNEIGTVEPIAQIGTVIRKANESRPQWPILFHTDACQAGAYLPLRPDKLHVDLLTLNGSKLYGPKQTGCLYVRTGVRISPLIHGGGQERGLRSGTENVAGAVGFATALNLAQTERVRETERLQKLQTFFVTEVQRLIPNSHLNGPAIRQDNRKPNAQSLSRLPNNVHFSFTGTDGEALVLYLDAHHIAAATGSACSSDSTDPSHVLKAIGLPETLLLGSLRFTLGKYTTKQELARVLKILPALVSQQRRTIREL